MSKLDNFVPADHPLRAIQVVVNDALKRPNGLFNLLYADTCSDLQSKMLRPAFSSFFDQN